MKLKQMSSTQSPPINLNLVKQTIDLIPVHTWDLVKKTIVSHIVDLMSCSVLEKLTGSPDGCDLADEILLNYYDNEVTKEELIIDSFKICGEEYILFLLDSLQLDKIKKPEEINV
jgi:hypothetical protein